MARTIKIDRISLRLKKKGSDEFFNFDNCFTYEYKGKILPQPFRDFFIKYVESFNGAFTAIGSIGKAISLTKGPDRLRVNIKERLISGIVEGGNSGVSVEVKDSSSSTNTLFRIEPSHVSSEPFHFLMWLPEDSVTGVLLLQGYSNSSVSDAFKENLAAFLRSQRSDVILDTGTIVDSEMLEQFRDDAVVKKMTFRRKQIDSDAAENLTGLKVDERIVNVDVVLSNLDKLEGFGEKVNRWMRGEIQLSGLIDIKDMEALGIDEQHQVIVTYEDSDGRRTSASSRKEFELKPQFYLAADAVKLDAYGRPDSIDMQKFLHLELERIKTESGYTSATSE